MTWRCAWCGREYTSNDPPCETCGHEQFESIADDSSSPFESGSLVWVCTSCGREHVKHSPPCSRCGNHTLEKRDAGSIDLTDDVSIPSYLSVGRPYLIGIAAVIVFVALVFAGVIPLPGLSGPPDPPNAPGEADRSAGLDLTLIEANVSERLNSERRAAGLEARERDAGLDAFAEYATRHYVAERYDPSYDGSMPDLAAFDPQCASTPVFGIASSQVALAQLDGEDAAADALVASLLDDDRYRDAVFGDGDVAGIDIHVGPDGTVFIGYTVC